MQSVDKTPTFTRHYCYLSVFSVFMALFLLKHQLKLNYPSSVLIHKTFKYLASPNVTASTSNFNAVNNKQELNCKTPCCSEFGYLSVNFKKDITLYIVFEVQLLVSTAHLIDTERYPNTSSRVSLKIQYWKLIIPHPELVYWSKRANIIMLLHN